MSHSLYITTYDRGTRWDTGRVKAYHWAFLIELSPSTGIKHQLRGMPGSYYYPGPEAADPSSEEPGHRLIINTKKLKIKSREKSGEEEKENKEDDEQDEDDDEEEPYEANDADRDDAAAQIVVAKLEIGSVDQSHLGDFEKACREAYVETKEVEGGEGGWNCQDWCLGVLEGLKGKDTGKDIWYGRGELKGWLREKESSIMVEE